MCIEKLKFKFAKLLNMQIKIKRLKYELNKLLNDFLKEKNCAKVPYLADGANYK